MDKVNTWWLGAMFWGLFSSVASILTLLSTWDRMWFGFAVAILVTFGFYGAGLLVKRTAKVWFDMEETEAKCKQ